MAPEQLAPRVRAYTATQTFSGITIDFNMLAKYVYESGVLKEDDWDA